MTHETEELGLAVKQRVQLHGDNTLQGGHLIQTNIRFQIQISVLNIVNYTIYYDLVSFPVRIFCHLYFFLYRSYLLVSNIKQVNKTWSSFRNNLFVVVAYVNMNCIFKPTLTYYILNLFTKQLSYTIFSTILSVLLVIGNNINPMLVILHRHKCP